MTEVTPAQMVTDQAPEYPAVLEQLLPVAWYRKTSTPTTASRLTTVA